MFFLFLWRNLETTIVVEYRDQAELNIINVNLSSSHLARLSLAEFVSKLIYLFIYLDFAFVLGPHHQRELFCLCLIAVQGQIQNRAK